MVYKAHIRDDGTVQTVKEHCESVSKMASSFLKKVKLNNTAYLSGLFHDVGKCTNEFTEYIENSHYNGNVKKGSVIHTFAGVVYFLNQYHNAKINDYYEQLTSEIIAATIGSHHSLIDLFDSNHESAFEHRVNKQPDYDKKAIANFLNNFSDTCEIEKIFKKSVSEITDIVELVDKLASCGKEYLFYIGLLDRLLISSIIDADRLDTMYFMSQKEILCFDVEDILQKCKYNLESYLNNFRNSRKIDSVRKNFSDICEDKSLNSNGIFRLNIPTGGGKTLSGMRFAINHALHNKMERIIYVSPLLSILEQNAKVIRDALDCDDAILEHHSNVINDRFDQEYVDRYNIMTESWNTPIIITTLVQLLNTIFESKTACVRRFHSLCNSVIIFDEVQTVPIKMLSLFNLAVNFLSTVCHSTVVLCSATQPNFENIELNHRIIANEIINIIPDEIIKENEHIFKRNTIVNGGNCRIEEIPNKIMQLQNKYSSVLIVCNTKKESEYLYKEVLKLVPCTKLFHLSSSMCVQHRRDVIECLKESLTQNEKTICISTQVVEAGVDISFDCAIRLNAGIDNIVQVAGRVNRNGDKDTESLVLILNCLDENLSKLLDIEKAQKSTLFLLEKYKKCPELFDFDISSEKAIKEYYKHLYELYDENYMDYPVKNKDSIFEMLSTNDSYRSESRNVDDYYLYQAFKTAGDSFKVLDNTQKTVVAPYDSKARDLIAKLYTDKAKYDFNYMLDIIKNLKPYTISLFDWQIDDLKKVNGITCHYDRILVLEEEFYDSRIGFVISRKESDNLCDIQIL